MRRPFCSQILIFLSFWWTSMKCTLHSQCNALWTFVSYSWLSWTWHLQILRCSVLTHRFLKPSHIQRCCCLSFLAQILYYLPPHNFWVNYTFSWHDVWLMSAYFLACMDTLFLLLIALLILLDFLYFVFHCFLFICEVLNKPI